MKTNLGRWQPREYISAAARALAGGDYLAPPSKNALVTGLDFIRAFRGVTLQAGKLGSRLFFLTDQNYAGLGTGAIAGTGNVFTVKQLLSFIGTGQLRFAGLNIAGIAASSVLSFIKKSGGVYAPGALTGPFQAGHAQPSAPTLYAKSNPSAGQTAMSGAVTVVIWRVSNITGQVSLKSLTSNVVTLNAQSAIVQFPLPDTNGQTHWGIGVVRLGFADLGVHYELPTSLGGEVAETTLADTRAIGAAAIVSATKIVDAAGGAFTAADIGRRVAFGSFDSWITAINSATQVQVNDTAGANYSAPGTITHAVNGITRAREISWANGSLIGQSLAPDKAFPPPAGQFAGVINDTLFLESDNIIYVSDPGFIGSFPPSNAIFPNEPAIHYLRGSEGVHWRFGKQSVGVLNYVGGSPAIEYQIVWENIGIQFPQNAALGAQGRLMLWSGKPIVMGQNLEPDSEFARRVYPDFAGWEAQTANQPVVPGFDRHGQYEVWCYQQKVMAYHVPSGKWCAPIDLTNLTIGNVVAAVTTPEHQLLLACSDGANINLYEFDAGAGSVMVAQTADYRGLGYGDTISEVFVQGRADNTTQAVKVEVIKDFADAVPILVSNVAAPSVGVQHFARQRPNIVNARSHAVRVTMTTVGGDAGVDFIETMGAPSRTITR